MLSQKYTILVVDDEPASLRMFERLLRQHYNVICATSGEEALNILKKEKVSLLISDHRMPGITGVELLQKSISIDPDMVRIIITGDTGIDTFVSALKHGGATRVIKKPWDPDELFQIIKSVLEKREIMLNNKQAVDQFMNSIKKLNKPSKG